MAEIVGAGATTFLARRELEVPPDWTTHRVVPCRQMVLADPSGTAPPDDRRFATGETLVTLVTLTASDVPDMLALIGRTRPGPFLRRTIEMGTYLGVRRDGTLIAMAGERLRPAGFSEISAVCTDLAYRGSGLASQLVLALIDGIRARGETPFLHLTTENEPAHRIYRALGFETRTLFDIVGVQAPA